MTTLKTNALSTIVTLNIVAIWPFSSEPSIPIQSIGTMIAEITMVPSGHEAEELQQCCTGHVLHAAGAFY